MPYQVFFVCVRVFVWGFVCVYVYVCCVLFFFLFFPTINYEGSLK